MEKMNPNQWVYVGGQMWVDRLLHNGFLKAIYEETRRTGGKTHETEVSDPTHGEVGQGRTDP